MDEILTVKEVAARLNVSRVTIWRWRRSGRLQGVRVGRNWRVRKSEVERLLGQSLE